MYLPFFCACTCLSTVLQSTILAHCATLHCTTVHYHNPYAYNETLNQVSVCVLHILCLLLPSHMHAGASRHHPGAQPDLPPLTACYCHHSRRGLPCLTTAPSWRATSPPTGSALCSKLRRWEVQAAKHSRTCPASRCVLGLVLGSQCFCLWQFRKFETQAEASWMLQNVKENSRRLA